MSEGPLYALLPARMASAFVSASDAPCIPDPAARSQLTECIDEMASASQLPHKIVNLLFAITNEDNRLTNLWGS